MSTIRHITKDERFAVISSRSCMPSSCWGNYLDLAIVEVDRERVEREPDAWSTMMISERSRAVKRIVDSDGRLHEGGMVRSSAKKTLDVFIERADALAEGRNPIHPDGYDHPRYERALALAEGRVAA